MKRIVCEMCDGTQFVKQDGMFICQGCGCQYSVEEAKKMMVEVPDDTPAPAPVATPSVRVDVSDELANLYQLARRAKDDNNAENAAKYYDLILLKDATSWEASFYLVYFKATQCKIAHIESAAHSVANCLGSVFQLISNHVSDEIAQVSAVKEVQVRCALIAQMLYNGAENHYNGIGVNIRSNYTQELVNNLCAARDILYTCGNQIDRYFGNNQKIGAVAATAWKAGVDMHKKFLYRMADQNGNKRVIESYTQKVGKYDAAYLQAFQAEANKEKLKQEYEQLRKKVTDLDNTIKNTPTEPKINCLGGFFLTTGAIMLILGLILVSLDSDQWWGLAVGLVELSLGFVLGRTPKSQLEVNRATVAKAKADLSVAQEKLNKFRHEHPEIK